MNALVSVPVETPGAKIRALLRAEEMSLGHFHAGILGHLKKGTLISYVYAEPLSLFATRRIPRCDSAKGTRKD